ncbi:MAG: hypothetical protein KKB79_03470 [Nanoarchaeota archaeon]|nr:hypothetical protein [Nanoarchaeota archaeon]
MNNKEKTVAFINWNLKETYDSLKNNNEKLYSFITRAIDDLKDNPFCGRNVKKKLIPKTLIKKHNSDNLWIYNLPSSWRLLYTIIGDEVKIVSVILDWMNHKDYERLFNF